ncbi:MAG: DNA polymerase III subunit gamma/tau [Candidatus Gastranaerophilales bacterium]|nr:DNA polymerase III subunit gamma/tau [Candidatus Gastranaerophilales bacterium]
MEQNYLPLFRKYRPQSFKDVVGQESLVKALSNAIELNRIANAYLFCGPRGTGKTSTARILAKSLNCQEGPTLEPCQKCASCVDITNATGLDVIEIDAASNRGIQDAKDLIAQVQYAPINGKYKIFIIDEVHMLSNDAFNALLKTFEEPPKNVIFILATTEPHKVLETIVSRCQRFDLRRITTDDIIKRLREISDIEGIKITDNALFTIAKNVSGGLRDSLALLDQVSILGVKEEIDKDLIEELLGKINFDVLLNLLKNIYDENIELTLQNIDEIYAKGNEPRNLAENFIEFLRNVILVLNSANPANISSFTTLVNADIEKITALNFDKDKVIKILNTLIEYYKEIKISTNPYLWMELAGIACARLDLKTTSAPKIVQTQAPQQIQTIKPAQAIQNAKAVAMSAQAPIPQAQPVVQNAPQQAPQVAIQPTQPTMQPVAQAPTQPTAPQTQQVPEHIAQNQDGAQIWMNIITAIPSLPTRAFYSGVAKLVGVENKTIKLGFLNDAVLTGAKSPAKYSLLENAINSTYSGYSVEFIRIDANTKVVEVKPKIAPAPQARPIQPQVQPTAQTQNPIKQESASVQDSEEEQTSAAEKRQYSPQVRDMIEQFNGRIID